MNIQFTVDHKNPFHFSNLGSRSSSLLSLHCVVFRLSEVHVISHPMLSTLIGLQTRIPSPAGEHIKFNLERTVMQMRIKCLVFRLSQNTKFMYNKSNRKLTSTLKCLFERGQKKDFRSSTLSEYMLLQFIIFHSVVLGKAPCFYLTVLQTL